MVARLSSHTYTHAHTLLESTHCNIHIHLCGPLPTLNNMHWLWALAAVATAGTPVSGSSDRDGGGVRVIGAGLGRTGSDSLREALTILGEHLQTAKRCP